MTKDKAKLEEVKAILHELQRIRPDLATVEKEPRPEPPAPAPVTALNGVKRATTAQEAVAASALRSVERTVSPARAAANSKGLLLAGGGVAVLAVAAAGGMYLFSQPGDKPAHPVEQVAAITPAAEHPAPPPTPDIALSIVQHAQKLMTDGDIKGAREALLHPAESGYPDAAFSLARSYDPNFLQTVANPNAGPDIVQAETWYRRWQEAAVKEGMVTNSLQLERILRSMH